MSGCLPAGGRRLPGGGSGFRLQYPQLSQEPASRIDGWPGLPGAPAVGWRERVGSERRNGNFEIVPECLTRPAGHMQGLRGSSERVRLLVAPIGDIIPCREAVAPIDSGLMLRDQDAIPVAKVGL